MVAVTMVVGVGFVVFFNFFFYLYKWRWRIVVDGYDSPKSRDATVLLDTKNDVVG